MLLDIVTASIISVAGMTGIVSAISAFLKDKLASKKATITIELKDGRSLTINTSEVSKDDIEKLLLKLEKKPIPVSKETGNVSADLLLLVIPGFIALMLAGTFIYLLIINQITPNYSTPKELSSAMTTIMGYYFGLGASATINKGQVLSLDQVKALTNG